MADYNSSGTTTHPFYVCQQVTPSCPVSLTTLGYYPNLGINTFFVVTFGLAGIITAVLGTWKKTWSYMIFITAGCVLELAGYAARIALHYNPWNAQAFETQICSIILAPTLVCISIYLTLKHICLSVSPELSRVRPLLYPFIFVPLDVSCLCVQAIGGGLAASAGYKNPTLLKAGNHCIIAGIVLQVIVLLFFGTTITDYYVRAKRWVKGQEAEQGAKALWHERKFRLFVYAVAGAYAGILIRCIYRIAEMAGGWGNKIMQDEPSFIVLEGFMILIPCWLLAAFPAGFLFPPMAERMSSGTGLGKKSQKKDEAKSDETKNEEKTLNTGDESQDPDQRRPKSGEPKSEEDVGA